MNEQTIAKINSMVKVASYIRLDKGTTRAEAIWYQGYIEGLKMSVKIMKGEFTK